MIVKGRQVIWAAGWLNYRTTNNRAALHCLASVPLNYDDDELTHVMKNQALKPETRAAFGLLCLY